MACPTFRLCECGQAFHIIKTHPGDNASPRIPQHSLIFIPSFIMKNILFIIASLRKQSFNRQVADYVTLLLKDKAQIEWLDFEDLPFVNEDIEYPAPAAVARVRRQVEQADGLWIFTPEYNYSYPAQLKNLLDWLSRPLKADDPERHTSIETKPVAITGIGGQNQTKDCREKLTGLLDFLRARVLPAQVGLAVNPEAWSNNQVVLTDEQKQELQEQTNAMLAFLG